MFPQHDEPNRPIFVKPGATDMRKQINGLTLMLQDVIGENPFEGACFMFCNRRRNMLKILYWEDNGFCLWTNGTLQKDIQGGEESAGAAEAQKNYPGSVCRPAAKGHQALLESVPPMAG